MRDRSLPPVRCSLRPRLSRSVCCPLAHGLPGLVLVLALVTPLMAQAPSGEYLLVHEGSQVLALRIQPGTGARIRGEVSVGGNTLPFEGAVQNGALRFTTTADGETVRWEAVSAGDGLRVTLRAPDGETATYTLARRGAGWSADSQLARQWQQRLTGRAFTVTERTGGGNSGGAVKDMAFTFCPGGRALYEERFTLNVAVPGLGGSGTSRDAEPVRWRALSSGSSAGIEVTADDGETFQLGIRAGSEADIVIVGDKPVRIRPAGDRCSHPALGGVR